MQNVADCCRMYTECSRMFQNVPECSRKHPACSSMYAEGYRTVHNACRMFQNACRMFQNAQESMQNFPECSFRMFQNAHRMFQNVQVWYIGSHGGPWACMQFPELTWSFMSLQALLWVCIQCSFMGFYAVPFFVCAAHKNFAVPVCLHLKLHQQC